MDSFRYRAMTASGARVAGHMEAANLDDLEARLRRMSLDLIDGRRHRGTRRLGGHIPRQELINFCFHLEQLSSAGVPLIEGLCDLRDSVAHARFRGVLAAMVESVEGGKRLSEAMAEHPGVFDPVTVSLVDAGEDSGTLAQMFARLVISLKWQDELAAQAKRLALYPAILAAVTLGLLLFVMIYLVPRMTAFMKGMGGELPWHTEALIAVSRFIVDDWALLISLPLAVAVVIGAMLRTSSRARFAWDKAALRVPLLGAILHKIILARFADVFALLYAAGIPVLDALRATEKVAGNRVVAQGMRRAARRISAGETLAEAFEHARLFPPLVIRMLRVGETTGALDRTLSNVSYFFNREVREAVERIQTLIEPAAIVVIGAVIGWIMLSVLGPIYDLVARLGA